MFAKQSFVKIKLRFILLQFLYKLENNRNSNFTTNGESFFIENLLKYLKNNPVLNKVIMFDIGANVGRYSKILVEKCQSINIEIHLFEPTSVCFEVLKNTFLETDKVILNKKATLNVDGTAEIFYDKQKSGFASFHKRNLNMYSIEMNHSENVETIRLDNYIKDKDIDHIHFIKIDVEGDEMFAFEGLGSYLNGSFIDFIQFEYGGANLDSHTSLMDLYTLLEKAGFVLAKVMPRGLDIRSYQPWMENFQYSNYVAISKDIFDKIA